MNLVEALRKGKAALINGRRITLHHGSSRATNSNTRLRIDFSIYIEKQSISFSFKHENYTDTFLFQQLIYNLTYICIYIYISLRVYIIFLIDSDKII